MVPPNKIIGKVAINIDLNKLSCNKYSKNFFEYSSFKLKTSLLKNQIKARTLPSWRMADKEGPGSPSPKKRDKTFKWAVLLTGINSVKPWIKPYKINFKYSKNL